MLRGILTQTGLSAPALRPLPSWPDLLLPQAKTRPVVVSATAERPPALTAVTRTPRGRWTQTGTSLDFLLPLPSSPRVPSPQARTRPVVVTATAKSKPTRTVLTRTPFGSFTETGRR